MTDESLVKPLSSDLTYLYKYIILPVSLIGFGAGVLLCILSPEAIPAEWGRGIFAFGMVMGLVMIAAMYMGAYAKIKQVKIKGNVLQISDFHQEIETPIENLKSVSGSLLMKPELVWLTFRQPTLFGEKIVFIGKYRFFAGWTLHPVVHELRRHLLRDDQENREGA